MKKPRNSGALVLFEPRMKVGHLFVMLGLDAMVRPIVFGRTEMISRPTVLRHGGPMGVLRAGM